MTSSVETAARSNAKSRLTQEQRAYMERMRLQGIVERYRAGEIKVRPGGRAASLLLRTAQAHRSMPTREIGQCVVKETDSHTRDMFIREDFAFNAADRAQADRYVRRYQGIQSMHGSPLEPMEVR